LPGVVAGWPSGDALGAVDRSETCKPCRPPPSLRSATAVLAATRGTGARSDAGTCGGRSAERFAERGARGEPPGEESAASGLPRGGLGSPRGLRARWRHGIESDLGPTAARSEVNQGLWGSCDMGLLESRSPRRDASADRKWRWPMGCPKRKPEVCTAVIEGPIAQFRTEATSPWKVERSTTDGIITQRRGPRQVDREGNVPDMRVS
jgi:hypothetical protein